MKGIYSGPLSRSITVMLAASVIAAMCLLAGCHESASSAPNATAPVPKAAADPNRFALLVGVDDYAVPKDMVRAVLPLKAPGNDVALMKQLLVEQYGFADDPAHITTLIGKRATRKAITENFLKALIEPARARGKEATVVFYFSGHGSTMSDTNGDEGDGVDETLVAYDSRIEGGQDILDDDINAWLAELRKYTSNITLIFDSCHSGSAARAGTAVGRKLPPHPDLPAPRAVAAPRSELTHAIVPQGSQYALLSGSRANEQSHEDLIETPEGRKMYGFFTYYLVETLRQSPAATYLEAVTTVEPAVVRHMSSQHPQAEGDVNRPVFGASADRDDPYIRVMETSGKQITLGAGQMLGLHEGTIVALYDPAARKLSGEKHRLANAIVKKSGVAQAVAELLEEPKSAINEQSKARLVTPYAGLAAMPVFIDELIDQDTSEADREVLTKLSKHLETNQLARRAAKTEPWSLGVRRTCLTPGAGCEEVYHLVTRNSNDPVTSVQRSASEDRETIAEALAEGISKRAKQQNVREINNAISSIGGQVTATLVAVEINEDENGNPRLAGQTDLPAATLAGVKVGEWYRIRVTNNSDEDLSVAVISLGSSGAINVRDVTPAPTGERIGKHGKSWSTQPFRIGPPLGLETYKVIATSLTNVNFTTLEQPPPAKAAGSSPLEWLLNQTTNVRTRDPQGFGTLSADSWTTARVDLMIQPD